MKLHHAIFTVLGLTPLAGMASDNFRYSFFEADYINLDIDDFDDNSGILNNFDDGDGFALRGYFELNNRWFVFSEFSQTDTDATFFNDQNMLVPANTDVKRFNLGVGHATPMSNRTDLVIRGAYSDIDFNDFDFGAGDSISPNDLTEDPSDGFFLDAGLRSQLTDQLEGGIAGRYTNVGPADGLSLVGNMLYEVTPEWGVNLEVDLGDKLSTWMLGMRYSF